MVEGREIGWKKTAFAGQDRDADPQVGLGRALKLERLILDPVVLVAVLRGAAWRLRRQQADDQSVIVGAVPEGHPGTEQLGGHVRQRIFDQGLIGGVVQTLGVVDSQQHEPAG
ncbi:hypothetical protein D3C71_1390040 [compost metagenome]